MIDRSLDTTSLEVRIPISARPDYFNRVRFIAQSIREFYPKATVTVTVSSDTAPFDIAKSTPWSDELGVRWMWVPSDEFEFWAGTEMPYVATIVERYRPPFFAEHVLMLDADVLPIRPFDELLARDHALLAMMAHDSPFRNHAEEWRTLFDAYGLMDPPLAFEFSGWDTMVTDPSRRFGPPYFNSGAVFGRASVMESLYEPYMAALRFVKNQMDTYFFDQIGITLALSKIGLPFELLPLRYNFPNQSEFDTVHLNELENVSLLHFLRTDIVDREKDFETAERIGELVRRRDLVGSNEVLRNRVATLLHAQDTGCE